MSHSTLFPRRFMLISLTVLIVLAAAAVGFNLYLKSLFKHMHRPGVPVETALVEQRRWSDKITTTASLFNREQNLIRSLVSAPIQGIYAQMGDLVEEGQLLMSLDPRSAQAALFEAKAHLNYAQYRFEQDQILFSDGALPEVNFQQSSYSLSQAYSHLSQAQDYLDDFQIRAPRRGIVGYSSWTLGDTVLLGDALVELWEPQSQRLRCSLGSAFHNLLPQGLNITVKPHGATPFSATIDQVAPALSAPQQRFWIEAVLDTPVSLPPGTEVAVEMSIERAEEVLVVPFAALDSNALGPLIWVVHERDEGGFYASAYPVSIIGIEGGVVAIAHSELQKGDTVIILGQFKLRPGQEVRPDVK